MMGSLLVLWCPKMTEYHWIRGKCHIDVDSGIV
jgi:hypothetical protein